MKYYYYVRDNNRQGPFTVDELKSHRIAENTLVWTEGLDNWLPASSISELREILIPHPPPIPGFINSEKNDQNNPVFNTIEEENKIEQGDPVPPPKNFIKEEKKSVKVSFKPFDSVVQRIPKEILFDNDFDFIAQHKEILFDCDNLEHASETISRYRKLKQLIDEYILVKNAGISTLALLKKFREFNDFKIPKIRQEAANEFWAAKKPKFILNTFIHLILAVISFYSIYRISSYVGAYPTIISIFHILILPVALTVLYVFLNFNIKNQVKKPVIAQFDFNKANNNLFSLTTLQSVFLFMFTIIVSIVIFSQKENISKIVERQKKSIEFEEFKSDRPLILVDFRRPGYIGGKIDSVIFLNITDQVEHVYYMQEGAPYYSYERYAYENGSWQGRGNYRRSISDSRIYIEYSEGRYGNDIKQPDRRIEVKRLGSGTPLEIYPRFVSFDFEEDHVEIVYMENNLESFINNTTKRTFIPRRQYLEILGTLIVTNGKDSEDSKSRSFDIKKNNDNLALINEIIFIQPSFALASASLVSDYYYETLFNYNLDSLLFDDGAYIRYIPNKLISFALSLQPPKDIYIYDNMNNFITKGYFKCHVRYETSMDLSIEALYDVSNNATLFDNKNRYYYIGNIEEHGLFDNVVSIRNEARFYQLIDDHFKVDTDYNLDVTISSNIFNNKDTLVIASVSKYQLEDNYLVNNVESFLFDLSNNRIDILFKMDELLFTYVYPTILMHNKKPVYVVGWGYPNSGFVGSIICFWNGLNYEPSDKIGVIASN